MTRRLPVLLLTLAFLPAASGRGDQNIQRLFTGALRAMGGDAFMAVNDIVSEGHYFLFDSLGRSSRMIQFSDYVALPGKARFESGNSRRDLNVIVVNLEENQGWIREGRKEIRDATPGELREFRNSYDRSLYAIFRFRRENLQNRFFYLGAGTGKDAAREMVRIIAPDNIEATVFFDRASGLPVKIESLEPDRKGVKQKVVDEFSQWRTLQGIHIPMRIDQSINGRLSSQQYILKIEFNRGLQEDLFGRPAAAR